MKILTVVGARPQFVKASPVSRELNRQGVEEWMVHTGQHYDEAMSDVFFREMGIPEPSVNLEVGSGSHARQTGEMMIAIEAQLIEHSPEWVLVYGDTNSTLAASLAAVKLQIPIAHVEAGLRSFNMTMPEEHNRVLSDRCADLLFCPTETARNNLMKEGISEGVHHVGDVMYDAVMNFREKSRNRPFPEIASAPYLFNEPYYVATVHRPYNTDDQARLSSIVAALNRCGHRVVVPLHPRTVNRLEEYRKLDAEKFQFADNVTVINPVGYLDMLKLVENAKAVLTDSGGLQKEAVWLETPCITMREESEWVETIESGWNVLVGAHTEKILDEIKRVAEKQLHPTSLEGEDASARIVGLILNN